MSNPFVIFGIIAILLLNAIAVTVFRRMYRAKQSHAWTLILLTSITSILIIVIAFVIINLNKK